MAVEGVEFLLRRAQARAASLVARHTALRAGAARAAALLVARLGATEVVLFGSVARGVVHERSDVDLAVWGVDAERLAEAVALGAAEVDARVDLVDMERAPGSLVRRVALEGQVLASAR
ncbi:MAG: hypothetical protein NVS3B10_01290 [Polyangiales bacterium]